MGYSKVVQQLGKALGYSLFFLSISDYKRLETSLYFIVTNFHTDLKPPE